MEKEKKPSIILRISKEASEEFRFPVFLALLVETITQFQVMSLIFATLYGKEVTTPIVDFLKKVTMASGIFGVWDITTSTIAARALWFVSAVYLIYHMSTLVTAIVLLLMDSQKRWLRMSLSVVSFIHGRVIFYPFHYFYLRLIYIHMNSKNGMEDSFFNTQAVFILTICLTIFNFILYALKEIIFYRVNKSQNSCSSKNNTCSQLSFVYKSLTTALFHLVANNSTLKVTIAVLSILYSAALLFTLYSKLPYYNVTLLKYSFILASFTASFSLIGLFSILASASVNKITDILLILLTLFIVKVLLARLNLLFEDIISGQISSADRAIHFPILLKKYVSKYSELIFSSKLSRRSHLFL